jgi:hypothetical protein
MRWAPRLLTFELRLLRSLLLLVLGRVDGVGPGDVALPYARAATATGVLFAGLSVAELVVVELLVPWPAVRHALLLVGAWGLFVVAGLLAMNRTHPHVARRDVLVVRSGGLVTVHVPWDAVTRVERRPRHEHSGWAIEEGHLHLPVAGSTAIDLALARPLAVRAGRRTGLVTRISLAVDDAAAALGVLGPLSGEAARGC